MPNTNLANATAEPAADYLDGFIDETQAADFLCQSVRTLQKWRVSGFGPHFYKPGRSVRYRRRDLLEWADTRRRAHTSAA
ncbi:helix-turn-helix domain-containing protein [uncultured Roseovarius sp.]|uniref:helix-turn-helix domain-containing protein n=1 Tax=uncultured Roseovarius sp. TaxID=293344 RepID=UPI0025E636B9|nr:helix-turn-helix domain-containing protein [uncultured Roseovarius sp.]